MLNIPCVMNQSIEIPFSSILDWNVKLNDQILKSFHKIATSVRIFQSINTLIKPRSDFELQIRRWSTWPQSSPFSHSPIPRDLQVVSEKIIQFSFFFIAEKVLKKKKKKKKNRHSNNTPMAKHNFSVCKKIFKMCVYQSMIRCSSFEWWVVKTKWATFAIVLQGPFRVNIIGLQWRNSYGLRVGKPAGTRA